MREELKIRLNQFKTTHPVEDAVASRIHRPPVEFMGDEILEQAISALLQGENLLLCGGKATGKNILCDHLAWLFGRPVSRASMVTIHVSSSMTPSRQLTRSATSSLQSVTLCQRPTDHS